jgi:hypothetical protein
MIAADPLPPPRPQRYPAPKPIGEPSMVLAKKKRRGEKKTASVIRWRLSPRYPAGDHHYSNG